MSVSDAVILLVADGLVAVGRVLGGLRARCAAEKHADALAEAEESRDSWEPDELWRPDGPSALVWPEPEVWEPGPYSPTPAIAKNCTCQTYPHNFCAVHGPGPLPGLPDRRAGAAQQRSAAVSTPAADNTTDCGCGSNDHCPDRVRAQMAADTAAADGTQLLDSIVALWGYHSLRHDWSDIGWWGCDGCNWTGVGDREHLLHRLALIADMKNATHRIQEQLGGAS